jgi:hypothetical protein
VKLVILANDHDAGFVGIFPDVTAGSIATTIFARCGAVACRVASMIAWLHNAPRPQPSYRAPGSKGAL